MDVLLGPAAVTSRPLAAALRPVGVADGMAGGAPAGVAAVRPGPVVVARWTPTAPVEGAAAVRPELSTVLDVAPESEGDAEVVPGA